MSIRQDSAKVLSKIIDNSVAAIVTDIWPQLNHNSREV